MEMDNLEIMDARMAMDIRRAFASEHGLCPDVEAELSRFHQAHTHRKSHRTAIMSIAAAVAAAAAMLAFVFIMYNRHADSHQQYTQLYAASGITRVAVTADGQAVTDRAASPVSVKGGDITVNGSASSTYNTIKTPSGQFFTLLLPDGTVVKLNAQSEFRFPTRFATDKREVYLKGEAYFDVHHDPKHPFVVKTDYFEAKAVGTSFNVRAYTSEQANVTLVEGRLIVSNDKQSPITIKPNEQTMLLKDGTLSTSETDTYQYTEWQNGVFYFDDIALGEILCEMGRWYNVAIDVANSKALGVKLHFVADRNASIDDALHNLNALGLFRVEHKGDRMLLR